ncbi:MAG TPA: MAC/perforin domain-containing protein [Candidatus Angelobacter sp.]|nr:MAC/perforin domain-containing protein [Candidatus Angelobacter sp.]
MIKHAAVLASLAFLGIMAPYCLSAQSSGPADNKPNLNAVWVLEGDATRVLVPKQAATASATPGAGATDVTVFFNPSYRYYPYLSIDMADASGAMNIYSDAGLRGKLVPVAGAVGEYSLVGTIVRDTTKPPAPQGPLGKLSISHKNCTFYARQHKPCFVLTQIAPRLSDSFGGLVSLGDRWFNLQEDQTQPPKDQQTYGNMFTPLSQNFLFVRKCYDFATIDFKNLQDAHCIEPIFEDLDGNSKRYRKVQIDKDVAIPYGWNFVSANEGHGENASHTLDTAREISNSLNTSVGVNASVSLFGVNAESHVKVGIKQKLDESRAQKTSESSYDYMWTDYALVLNRSNVRLSKAFKDSISSLAVDGDYQAFMKQWGTHYTYATTFGVRSHRTIKMTEEQVATVNESGFNVDAGLKVGYSAMGMGASVGVDVGVAEDQNKKIKDIVGATAETLVCYGGSGCDGGHVQGTSVIPVQLDLRPISELLGPPFYYLPVDKDIYTRVRDELAAAIAARAFSVAQNLDESANRFILVRATPSSDRGTLDANVNTYISSLDIKLLTCKMSGSRKNCAPSSMLAQGRPLLSNKGLWVVPYSGGASDIDRVLVTVNGKTSGNYFTCALKDKDGKSIIVPEGTPVFAWSMVELSKLPDTQKQLWNWTHDSGFGPQDVTCSSPAPEGMPPSDPGIGATISFRIVNSVSEMQQAINEL